MQFDNLKSGWMNEDHILFQDAATRFLTEQWVPRAEGWRKAGIMERETWNEAGEAGLLCASVPEEYGGAGGDFGHEAILSLIQGHVNLASWGQTIHSGIVAHYVLQCGTEEQKRRWLPKMATGEIVGALAMTEPSGGSDLQGLKSRAIRDGNVWRLSGQKTFITNGQHANLIVAAAKTRPEEGAKGISLLVVETEAADGFSRGRNLDKVGLKAADTSELFFDDVPVPPENILGGEENRGFYQMMEQLPQERLLIACGAVGAMEGAVRRTIDYCKEREAFGKPLIAFQNTAFRLAECKTGTVAARAFLDSCIGAHLKGELSVETAAMVKYWTTDLQMKIIDECVQLHGGYGYMMEYDVAEMWTDARVQRIYGGANEIMKDLISRKL